MLAWEEAGSSEMLSKMSSRGQRKAPGPDQPQAPRKADEPPPEEQGAAALLPAARPKSPIHKCPQCTYSTNCAKALERHMQRSHMGRTYRCTLCGATSTSYEETRSHRYWAFDCRHAEISEVTGQLGRIRISIQDQGRGRRGTPIRPPTVRVSRPLVRDDGTSSSDDSKEEVFRGRQK